MYVLFAVRPRHVDSLPRRSTRCVAAGLLVAAGAPAVAQSTDRANTSSIGAQSAALASNGSLSSDGRFVCFTSSGADLVSGDTNGASDVFVKDRATGTTERVSLGAGGVQGNGASLNACISGNGRFVAFQSAATNLIALDTNGVSDVFVRDRVAQTTERVSITTAGVQGNDRSEIQYPFHCISKDGRFVVFQTLATNFLGADLNPGYDVFIRDRTSSSLQIVSLSSANVQGNSNSYAGSVSDDGFYVAFLSHATNLVAGDTNGVMDVFLRNRNGGFTNRINVGPGGAQATALTLDVQISGNGTHVVFDTTSPTLVAGDTNARSDVFRYGIASAVLERASLTSSGMQLASHSMGPRISDDGRYVFFHTQEVLDAGDTGGDDDVFRRDMQLGTIERLTLTEQGSQANGPAWSEGVSGDGECVAFRSPATNLVAGDTNGQDDVFVRQRARSGVQFCTSDDFDVACPCGNDAAQGGCQSSIGAGGVLVATGLARVAADGVVLAGSSMPDGSAVHFQGDGLVAGGMGVAFGDGLRCAGGSVFRLAVVTNSSGGSSYPAMGEPSISVAGAVPAGGGARYYQVWYRNATAYCTSATYNLTNAVRVTWIP